MKLAGAAILAVTLGTSASAQTTTYTYDTLGRLTTTQRSDGLTTQYTLDNAGNRTHATTGGGSGAAPQRPLSSSRTADTAVGTPAGTASPSSSPP